MFVHMYMLCQSAVSHPARSFTSVEMKGEGEKCFHMPKEAFDCMLCKNKTTYVYVHYTPLFEPPRQKKSQSRRTKLHHSPYAKYIS